MVLIHFLIENKHPLYSSNGVHEGMNCRSVAPVAKIRHALHKAFHNPTSRFRLRFSLRPERSFYLTLTSASTFSVDDSPLFDHRLAVVHPEEVRDLTVIGDVHDHQVGLLPYFQRSHQSSP